MKHIGDIVSTGHQTVRKLAGWAETAYMMVLKLRSSTCLMIVSMGRLHDCMWSVSVELSSWDRPRNSFTLRSCLYSDTTLYKFRPYVMNHTLFLLKDYGSHLALALLGEVLLDDQLLLLDGPARAPEAAPIARK